MKKVRLLGLSAVTSQAWLAIFTEDVSPLRGSAFSVPPARKSLMPR